MNELVLQDVTVALNGQPMFKPVNLTVGASQVVVIMGPSGSGKSTLLNHLLGTLDSKMKPSGQVQLGQQVLNELPTEQRAIGLVAQDDWLFPHMSVWQNLRFAQPRALAKRQAEQQIIEFLNHGGLTGLAQQRPNQLSGGQRQRVAVLRMLLSQPKAVLLDEPFSKLDQQLRQDFRQWCFSVIAQRGLPALLVTHDVQDLPASTYWHIAQGGWCHA